MTDQSLLYADGAVVLARASPAVRVPEDEIVCLAAPVAPGDHYTLAWLHERKDDAGDNTAEPLFALETAALSEAEVQQLPVAVRTRHLLGGGGGGPGGGPAWLADAALPALHVVVSTGSGLGRAQAFYDAVLRPLLAVFVGHETADDRTAAVAPRYNVLVTSSSRSISELAHRLAARKTDREPTTVILLSGDGGVVDLLNGVTDHGGVETEAGPGGDTETETPVTIAVLPLGTGNALFHSLHRPAYAAAAAAAAAAPAEGGSLPPSPGPSSLVLGLRTLLRGRPRALPDFVASFSPGAHTVRYAVADEPVEQLRGAIVASYGFHAQLVWESDTPEYRQHGDKRFGMAAGALLELSHAYVADVAFTESGTEAGTPGTTHALAGHRFHYALATLVSNLEKTFTISPASRPLDGQLRLVHFGAIGAARTMEVMTAAYRNGAHVGMQWPAADDGGGGGGGGGDRVERVGYDAIDSLEVHMLEEDARWRKVCIDGTIVEIPQGGWMKVRRAPKPALRVLAAAC